MYHGSAGGCSHPAAGQEMLGASRMTLGKSSRLCTLGHLSPKQGRHLLLSLCLSLCPTSVPVRPFKTCQKNLLAVAREMNFWRHALLWKALLWSLERAPEQPLHCPHTAREILALIFFICFISPSVNGSKSCRNLMARPEIEHRCSASVSNALASRKSLSV